MNFRAKFLVLMILAPAFLTACRGESEGTPTAEVVVVVVTATEEPTPESSVTPEIDNYVMVTQDLNMRAGDNTNYPVMTVIPGGSKVLVTGKNEVNSWYQISYHDVTGWISITYTEGQVTEDLPVAVPPPLSLGNDHGNTEQSTASPTITSTASNTPPAATPTLDYTALAATSTLPITATLTPSP